LNTGKLLTPKICELMRIPMMTSGGGRFIDYAMRLLTTSTIGRFVINHSGSQNETQTFLLIVPAQNFAIAVTMNFDGAVPFPRLSSFRFCLVFVI
jgi:hypothetical protein